MYASHSDHVGIIELLARVAPSCVNQADSRGRTPLMLSAMWGQDKSVAVLLKVILVVGMTPLVLNKRTVPVRIQP